LEFHHGPVPFAAGGKATAANIHLLCRAHNRYESEQYFGPMRERGGTDRAGREGLRIERAGEESVSENGREGAITCSRTGAADRSPALTSGQTMCSPHTHVRPRPSERSR